jgi:hypothetical protein
LDKRYFIHSFARGLKLLEQRAEAGEPLPLSQIAKWMDMTLSTAYRFSYTSKADTSKEVMAGHKRRKSFHGTDFQRIKLFT